MSIFSSLLSAANPRVRLSGDQKASLLSSVPAKGRASSASRSRTHRRKRPSGPLAVNARCRPSGDRSNACHRKFAFSGGKTWKRINWADAAGVSRKCKKAKDAATIASTDVAAHGSARGQKDVEIPAVATMDGSGAPERTSLSEMRASPIACRRCFASFCKQRCKRTRTRTGVALGSWDQSTPP
jgi:hypothetical protein